MSRYYLYLLDLSKSVYIFIKFHSAQSAQLALPETHSLTDVFGYGLVCTCPLRYYTDFNYPPVRLIAQASLTGHGTNVIAGMSVGVWEINYVGICGHGF